MATVRGWRALAVVALALAVGACGGDGGGSGGGGDTAEEGGNAPAGPLAEFFGYDEFDPEQFEDQERRAQELIVACMAEEGFEYLPVTYPEMGEDPAFTAREELSPEEYAREYGYGITTYDMEAMATEAEFTDPNAATVEAMEPAEQEAYYQALYGDMPELAPDATEEETVEYGFGGGCQGKAAEEIYGGGGEGADLQPKYEELYERIQADPRTVEATAAWSACMSEAGYDFSSREDPFNHIAELQNALYEDMPVPEEVASDAEFVEPEVDEARLEEIREEEIAIAVTDQECGAEHFPPELQQEISAEYEQEFIEENREALERARDAQNG